MLLKLALAVIPLAVIAGVLMYVADVQWAISIVVLVVVSLVVYWSRRRSAGARPAGGGMVQGDQELVVARPERPDAVVVVVAPPPLPLPRPLPREPAAVQPSAPPVADDVALLAYAYEKKRKGSDISGDGGGYDDVDGEECSVCLGEMRQGEVAKRLPVCLHVFHEGCIDMWLGSHATCPICRSPVDAAGAGAAASAVAARVQVQSC